MVAWSTIKTKLNDPVKTLADGVNTALVSAFDYSVRQVTTSDTIVAGDHMRCVEVAPTVTVATTLTLSDAATMTNVYRVFIKNSSTANATLTRATSGDTLDGVAGSITLPPKSAVIVQTTTGANGYIIVAAYGFGAPLPRSYLSGFAISNNATTTKLDVAAGACRDSTDSQNIVLTSAITAGLIQTSGSWAAGSTQNKLDTGARANSTWYHVYAIRKDTDGTGDFLFSLSASSPTMPSGYTYFRRIGSVLTDGSGNITAFTQVGDEFIWSAQVRDVSAATAALSATLVTLSVPTGVKVTARFRVSLGGSGALADTSIWTSPDETDVAPDNATGKHTIYLNVAGRPVDQTLGIRTNTSAQVRHREDNTADVINVWTFGWADTRGRDL